MSQLGKSSLLDGSTELVTRTPSSVKNRGIDRRRLGVIALTVLSLGVLSFVVYRSFSQYQNSPNTLSRYRTLVDSETGKVFENFRIPNGASFPVKNPDTGNSTLYMAEACYWTKEGKAKLSPTWVLVKETIGQSGPTLCPDCGRRVVPHNPTPPDELMIEAAQAAAK